jgi:lipopolysaccharide biosynthesis regulator YciM
LTETALAAVVLATVAGLLAGRSWSEARRRQRDERSGFRSAPAYAQALHHLASGHLDAAITELGKLGHLEREAPEVLLLLGSLQREVGQVERAIQSHQTLRGRRDLSRAERAQALAALGTDYRKAGFLDRATRTFEEVLELEPKNFLALTELQRLCEEQRLWRRAYELRARLARLRKRDDSLVLGHIQAEMGREAQAAGDRQGAERAFRAALSLNPRVFPAHLGLADLVADNQPAAAAVILEEAMQASPERGYLAFDRLQACWERAGEPARFLDLCERIIRQDPRDWRARLALARQLRANGKHDEAFGLLLRAVSANPHVLATHLEVWRAFEASRADGLEGYLSAVEDALFYRDPHVCTACRYRSDDMLWRCPHCHEWDTFVEERVAAPGTG